jgi:TatD DNase family protein
MKFLIDTHAHLDSKQFDDDRDEVIRKCKMQGFKYIIDPATNYETCKKVIDLSEKYDVIYTALGIHPHDAKEYSDNIMLKIEEMLKIKKVLAIGEIGLDYHYDFSPVEAQKTVFREFLKLAKRHSLPVIIHNRESDKDMMDILESEYDANLKGQFHCFSGDLDLAKRILDFNFYISFTGSVTFNKNKSDEILRNVPFDRLLLETDSPYMAPIPYRGKRNDPANIPVIVKYISTVLNKTEDEIIEQTNNNAVRFFNLPEKGEKNESGD